MLFFQWRASRSGAEKFHSAMLPHAGTSSRVWREVCELGAAVGRLGEVRGSQVLADAAILWDWESFWAQDLEWRPSVDLDHRERVHAVYDRLWRDGLTVDFAHPEADLSAYPLVVAPASYLVSEAGARNLTSYVEAGGTLVVLCFSGIVDEHDAVHAGGYLAPLADALGVTVEEFLPLRDGEQVRLAWTDEDDAEAMTDVWADHVVLRGAETVARYVDGPAAGGAAVTRHPHGTGTGWYVSTHLTGDGLAHVLHRAYADAGVAAGELPDDVEVIHRHGAEADYLVAVNHTDESVAVPADGLELLSGEPVAGAVKVRAGGVVVVRTSPSHGAR